MRRKPTANGPGPAGEAKVALSGTVDLLKRYVLQETVGPLRRIGKTLAFGASGAIVFGIGAVIVLIGFLRLLEGETGTTFAGNWSFAPYLITTVAAVLLAGGAVALVLRGSREKRPGAGA